MRVVEPPPFPSTQRVRAVRRYIRGRAISSFALIDTHGRLHGFAPHRRYITASVVKAMILVARLRQIGNRMPSASDQAVLNPMIQVSDNDAATVAYGWVGDSGLLAVAKRAGMHDLTVGGYWGNVFFSAADQAHLFLVSTSSSRPARAPTRATSSPRSSPTSAGASRATRCGAGGRRSSRAAGARRAAAHSCTRRPCSSAAGGASRLRS